MFKHLLLSLLPCICKCHHAETCSTASVRFVGNDQMVLWLHVRGDLWIEKAEYTDGHSDTERTVEFTACKPWRIKFVNTNTMAVGYMMATVVYEEETWSLTVNGAEDDLVHPFSINTAETTTVYPFIEAGATAPSGVFSCCSNIFGRQIYHYPGYYPGHDTDLVVEFVYE